VDSNGNRGPSQGQKSYLFDNPENIQRLLRSFYVCCAILLMLDFVVHRHIDHPWQTVPGFYALYGFIGCVILVMVAKWMRTLLMRPEDYYERSLDD
jgi:hypothetical protein